MRIEVVFSKVNVNAKCNRCEWKGEIDPFCERCRGSGHEYGRLWGTGYTYEADDSLNLQIGDYVKLPANKFQTKGTTGTVIRLDPPDNGYKGQIKKILGVSNKW